MRPQTIVIWIIVAIIVVGGIVYLAMPHYSPQSVAPQTATTTSTQTTTVMLGSSAQFSKYLEASNGMALYTYKNDKPGVSNCTGLCAVAWPPYKVSSGTSLSAGPNISGTLSTITRSDGTQQVTYNGMPLYFWSRDTASGQVTGNNVNGFTVATP